MILVEAGASEEWDSKIDWAALANAAVRAAVASSRHRALIGSGLGLEVSVKFTGDSEVRALNAAYRAKDQPTNVLSFPMVEPDMLEPLVVAEAGEALLGDVVLGQGVCAREAKTKGLSIADHAAHLVVHGTLHLLGYDHETGDAQADAMERVESDALTALGIADPYRINETSH